MNIKRNKRRLSNRPLSSLLLFDFSYFSSAPSRRGIINDRNRISAVLISILIGGKSATGNGKVPRAERNIVFAVSCQGFPLSILSAGSRLNRTPGRKNDGSEECCLLGLIGALSQLKSTIILNERLP